MASLTNFEDDVSGRRRRGGVTLDNEALVPPVTNESADDSAMADTPPPPPDANTTAIAIAATDPSSISSPPQAMPSFVPFGVSESTLLEPVMPPPKKKRRMRDEFTISQKLSILSELRGPNAVRVPDLAARHNTSRTSIYRWKNDLPRLTRLASKREGRGDSKRVGGDGGGRNGNGGNNNKGNGNNGASSSSSSSSSTSKKSKGKNSNDSHSKSRGKKRRKNEEYTAAERLAIVRELSATALKGGDTEENDADTLSTGPPPSVRAVADRVGANHRSVYRWRKDEARLARLVEEEGRGTCKRAGDDPMSRLKEALRAFHAVQYGDADIGAGRGNRRLPLLTGTVVATKARQIRDELLARHGTTPFLTDAEVRALRDFTGSTSWGRKIVQKFGWKGTSTASLSSMTTSATAEGASEEPDDDDDGDDEDNLEGRMPPPPSLPVARINEMKREIASLRRKLHGAEARARGLEAVNAELKSRLATLTNKINSGAGRGAGNDHVVIGSIFASGCREEEDLFNEAAGMGGVAADAFTNAAAVEEVEGDVVP